MEKNAVYVYTDLREFIDSIIASQAFLCYWAIVLKRKKKQQKQCNCIYYKKHSALQCPVLKIRLESVEECTLNN